MTDYERKVESELREKRRQRAIQSRRRMLARGVKTEWQRKREDRALGDDEPDNERFER